jgi:hypothetical protein
MTIKLNFSNEPFSQEAIFDNDTDYKELVETTNGLDLFEVLYHYSWKKLNRQDLRSFEVIA